MFATEIIARSGTYDGLQGLSNYSTWNVHFWADRDEQIHVARLSFIDGLNEPVAADEVRGFLAAAGEKDRLFRKGLLGQ